MTLKIDLAEDAAATERIAAAAYLLGTALLNLDRLSDAHRSQLREIARHLIEALDEYTTTRGGGPR